MVVRSGTKRNKTSATSKQKNLTARLLVLGDKRVGKSAAIVRYTTGRFIEQYAGKTTNDWLYRHEASNNRVAQSVEILEQTDIQFCSTNNIFISSAATTAAAAATNINSQQSDSTKLASRVALDQQIDNELQEKQQLMNKLRWAHAYVIIYAIDDISTFNKAIKYLNLIANNINSPSQNGPTGTDSRTSPNRSSIGQSPNGSSSSASSACSGSSASASTPSSSSSSSSQTNNSSSSNKFANRLSSNSQSHLPLIKRPIVLVGNKKDLETSCRQVNASDARMLAMRHQSMFAEVSIASSSKLIESIFVHLIEQIDGSRLHVDLVNQNQLLSPSSICKWNPNYYTLAGQTQSPAPIWGNLVRSKPIGLVQSRQLATITKVDNDVRLVAPMSAVALTAGSRMSHDTQKRPSADGCYVQPRPPPPPTRKLSFDHQLQQPTHQSRYESLKSSFKRASMAIVSSKALARGSRSSKEEPKRSSIDEEVANSAASTTTTDLLTLTDSNQSQQASTIFTKSSAFKRPLFRYKSRRKSVAFEQIATPTDRAEIIAQPAPKVATATSVSASGSVARFCSLPTACRLEKSGSSLTTTSGAASNSYNLVRGSGEGSSSSLDTSDTYYTSPMGASDLDQQANLSGNSSSNSSNMSSGRFKSLQTLKKSSRSTLSRASTSAGSYDESGDDYIGRSESRANSRCQATAPDTSGRHHLVRSVQGAMTGLTKSSSGSSHAAKKSFCSSLLSRISNNHGATVKTEPLLAGLAKAETINIAPVMGFCE